MLCTVIGDRFIYEENVKLLFPVMMFEKGKTEFKRFCLHTLVQLFYLIWYEILTEDRQSFWQLTGASSQMVDPLFCTSDLRVDAFSPDSFRRAFVFLENLFVL